MWQYKRTINCANTEDGMIHCIEIEKISENPTKIIYMNLEKNLTIEQIQQAIQDYCSQLGDDN